jgi:hypothetical protein
MSNWNVVGRNDAKSGVATVAENSTLAPSLFAGGAKPAYIKVHCDGRSEILLLEPRPSGVGDDIFIAVGTFGLGANDSKPCEVQFISKEEFLKQQLLGTKAGKVALLGLTLAAAGVVLDWALKVLAALPNPKVEFLANHRACLLAAAGVLQIAGLGFAFWKTFRKGEY